MVSKISRTKGVAGKYEKDLWRETDGEPMDCARWRLHFFDVRYLSFKAMAILFFDAVFRHAAALGRQGGVFELQPRTIATAMAAVVAKGEQERRERRKINGNTHVLRQSNV